MKSWALLPPLPCWLLTIQSLLTRWREPRRCVKWRQGLGVGYDATKSISLSTGERCNNGVFHASIRRWQ